MGICLFLALMKKIKGTDFSIALLDDVMMSIDTGHRKRLCELLKKEFSNTQLIITTHDPVWARQLKEHGVVSKKNLFHFRNWSLEVGPVFEAKDAWDILKGKANTGFVHDAAAGLRINLELEFQDICSNLQAKVPFKASHSWTLGELKDASVSRIKQLLGKAKAAANSWGNKEAIIKLKSIEDELNESIKVSNVDQWQLNPSLHYNEWGNFSKEDIIPLIDSMERLTNSFGVNSSKLFLTFKDGSQNPVALTTFDSSLSFALIEKDEGR
jgi:energy-coupling factor transporter ATP-binding protein EcfA2